MIVISISGPCGSGKSTLIKMLSAEFELLDCLYKNSKGAKLPTTSYLSKVDYFDKWFKGINLQNKKEKKIIISDRSPFDCLAYLKERKLHYKRELSKNFQLFNQQEIFHYPILITASREELEERIEKRFKNGLVSRDFYNQEMLLLNQSLKFFNRNISFYASVFDTTFDLPNQTFEKIKNFISDIKTTKKKATTL